MMRTLSRARSLNEEILDNDIRVIFCIIAGCQTSAIHQEDSVDDTLKRYSKITTSVVDEADTVLIEAHRHH